MNFKPSDVPLCGHPYYKKPEPCSNLPLYHGFGKYELEEGATWLLRALVRAGDEWRAVPLGDVPLAGQLDSQEGTEPLAGLIKQERGHYSTCPDFRELLVDQYGPMGVFVVTEDTVAFADGVVEHLWKFTERVRRRSATPK